MALRARSKVLFALAALLLAGAAFCGLSWRHEQAGAEESARLGTSFSIDTRDSQAGRKKNASEWRLLGIVGLALGGAAAVGGMITRRG